MPADVMAPSKSRRNLGCTNASELWGVLAGGDQMMRWTLVLIGCLLASGAIARAEDVRGGTDSMELASGLKLRGKLAETKLRVTTVLGGVDVQGDSLQTLVCLPPTRSMAALWTRGGDVLVGK